MSCQTSTWASVSGPAPMPMVGIGELLGDRLATSPGTISSTTANAPASATARASARTSSRLVAAALHPVAADGVLALRGEADVGHHRDAGAGDRLDLRGDAAAALELDGVRAALLHEPDGGAQRLGRALLVRAERQVADDQRALGGADHRAYQGEQLVDGDRERSSRSRRRCWPPSRRPAAPGCRPRRRSRRCTGRRR